MIWKSDILLSSLLFIWYIFTFWAKIYLVHCIKPNAWIKHSSKVCATMFTNSYNSWNIAQKKMMDQCNITQAFHLDWIVYEVNYDGFLLGNKFSQNMVFCNIVLSFRNAFFVLLERKLFLIVKESQRSRICIQWESKRWTVY